MHEKHIHEDCNITSTNNTIYQEKCENASSSCEQSTELFENSDSCCHVAGISTIPPTSVFSHITEHEILNITSTENTNDQVLCEEDSGSCEQILDTIRCQLPEQSECFGEIENSDYPVVEGSPAHVNHTGICFDELIESISCEPIDENSEEENLNEYLDIDKLIDGIESFDDEEDNDFEEDIDLLVEENKCDTVQTIYRGHHMPVWVSMLMVLLHMITSFVSKKDLEHILILVSSHCLETHPGLRSLYHFKKHFASMSTPIVKHFYCTNCLGNVNEKDIVCSNQHCLISLTNSKSKSYFVDVSIKDQLKILFNRQKFASLIIERYKRNT